jgi:hypothetical protein
MFQIVHVMSVEVHFTAEVAGAGDLSAVGCRLSFTRARLPLTPRRLCESTPRWHDTYIAGSLDVAWCSIAAFEGVFLPLTALTDLHDHDELELTPASSDEE